MNRVQMVVIDLENSVDMLGPYEPGLWFYKTYLSAAVQAASFWVTAFSASFSDMDYPTAAVSTSPQINSNGLPLLEYTSLGDLRAGTSGFYFDSANQDVIIKLPSGGFWKLFDITKDQTFGLVDKATYKENFKATQSMYNGVYYEPRLISPPSDSQSLDNILENRMNFDGFTFSALNNDGKFDEMRGKMVGAECRYLLADSLTKDSFELSDFEIVQYGRVESVSYKDPMKISVRVADSRKDWDIKIGTEIFTSDDYTGIDSKLQDKRKPLAFGPCLNIPLHRIYASSESNYTRSWYVVSPVFDDDADIAVTTVYQELDGARTTVSGSAYSFTRATGVLLFTADRDESAKYYADITGALPKIDTNASVTEGNLIDIALALILEYTNREYNTLSFNTTAIDVIRIAALAGSLYIPIKGAKLKDLVELLLSSNNTRIQPQGASLTMLDLSSKTATREFEEYEKSTLPDGWAFDEKYFFSTVRGRIVSNVAEEEFQDYYSEALKETALENNNKEIDYEFNTALTSRADLITIADARYDKYSTVPRLVYLNLETPINFELGDYVINTVQRQNASSAIVDRATYEVIALSKTSRTATLLYIEANPATIEDTYNRRMYNDDMNNDKLT